MKLKPADFETLTLEITEAFNVDDLRQVVRFKMGADMFTEWVKPDQPFKTVVFDLVTKLEQLGTIIFLIEVVMGARPDNAELQQKLTAIKAALAGTAVATGDKIDDVRKGISEVGNRLAEMAIRQAVTDHKDILQKLFNEIALLRTYKSLHDCLHNLQMQLRGLATATRNLVTNPDATADLVQSVTTLRTLRDSVATAIDHLPDAPPYRESENRWLQQFDRAIGLAQQASDNNDTLVGKQGVFEIRGILRRQPVRIDGNLTATASSLEMADLKSLFIKASATPGLADDERQRFLSRAGSAEQLFRQLRALVNQHSEWQKVDQSLWDADENVPKSSADDPSDFDAIWLNIIAPLGELLGAETQAGWAKTIAERRDKIQALRKDDDWAKLRVEFARFRQEAIVRFFAVDTTLLQLAGQVATIGDTLLKLLTDLRI